MKTFKDPAIRTFITDFININYEEMLIRETVKHADKDILKAFCLELLTDFQREFVYKNNTNEEDENKYDWGE